MNNKSGHHSPISGISTFKDELVATAGYDNQVILWNRLNKEILARAKHKHLVNSCEFSPDGRFLATASSDYTVRIWEIPSLQNHTIFRSHQDDVEMVTFHPSKPLIASASRDRSVQIHNIKTGSSQLLGHHNSDALSVAWSKDGDHLISTGDDGILRKWCHEKGQELNQYYFGNVETDTIAIINEQTIYAGNDKGEIVCILNGKKSIIKAHDSGVKRIVVSPSLGFIVSMSYDRSVKIWRINDKQHLSLESTAILPWIVWPRSCAFATDEYIVFGTFGTTYVTLNWPRQSWDTRGYDSTKGLNHVFPTKAGFLTCGDAGEVLLNQSQVGNVPSLLNFSFEVEGNVYAGGQTGALYNVKDQQIVYQHYSPLNCFVFDSDKEPKNIYIGSYTGDLLKFSISDSGKIMFEKLIKIHQNAIKSLSSNASLLFSLCADTSVSFYSLTDLSLIKYYKNGHEKIANGATWIGNDIFASVSRDLKIRFWSINSIEKISSPHSHSIKCISTDLEKNWLATGSYDGTVCIYNLKQSKFVNKLSLSSSGISSIHSSNIDKTFIASSYNGLLYQVHIKNEMGSCSISTI
ncbi:MAG TPA: WD40 repeat domain-containing protein [Oligoflexia bacterium]|nr:WD40 repeat domain-containing protein [Oligoflexia bacterium]HMR25458.1 WD40 repeat domain-containing protein [Oligoflexia bacterium]